MALLFWDGFEGIQSGANGGTLRYPEVYVSAARIDGDGFAAFPPSPNGRFYQYGDFGSGNAAYLRKSFTNSATSIIGFRFRPKPLAGITAPTAERTFFALGELTGGTRTYHLWLSVLPDLSLQVRRSSTAAGGTILGTSSANAINFVGWNYIEIKSTINDSTGAVEVRVGGSSVITLTGIDTQNAGNAYVNFADWTNLGQGVGDQGLDDIYICDTTGGVHDDFLGNVRVVEMLPSAAGDSTQWTPNAGNNWDRVDDTNWPDFDTTYVSDSTAGETDLYNLAAPSSSATIILSAKTVTIARKATAGAQSIETLIKSGSTTDASAPIALTDSYLEYQNEWLQNPDTSADWTIADLDALQSGFRIPV